VSAVVRSQTVDGTDDSELSSTAVAAQSHGVEMASPDTDLHQDSSQALGAPHVEPSGDRGSRADPYGRA
jgi:hypothetical protein